MQCNNIIANVIICMNQSNRTVKTVALSCPSISSMNCNYYSTCKVWNISICVNTMINHSCAMAPPQSLLVFLKDVNSEAVCPVHHCNAP